MIFFHSVLSVAVEQSESEPCRLRGVGDPTRACVQASQDHGRGQAVLDLQVRARVSESE